MSNLPEPNDWEVKSLGNNDFAIVRKIKKETPEVENGDQGEVGTK